MIAPRQPALVLAPMDGITDAPMRDYLGQIGAFTFAVSEFIRVSGEVLPPKTFLREVPELLAGAKTRSGLPVQVQILGGDPDRVAQSAVNAVRAGATAIDINFGCPAPTVNRNDGGASLLRFPNRIREIVLATREAVPPSVPVSAKLRLGWDAIEAIHENAQMAFEGGAAWLTIHARTRVQGYKPPVFWPEIRKVRESLPIPIVANGDIWNLDDFRRCREETGCEHFMIGRASLANPALVHQIARELGLPHTDWDGDWASLFDGFVCCARDYYQAQTRREVFRVKQWASLAQQFGEFDQFNAVKRAESVQEFFQLLA